VLNVKHSSLRLFGTAMILVSIAVVGLAQTSRTRSTKPATSGLLAALPPSDAVATIKVNRVIDEALPKLLAENPAMVASINDELAKFKTQTGLDPRSFDEVAVGIKYVFPSEGVTRLRTVALARGTFNAAALVAAGRLAANGKYVEENYQGKKIYIFTLDRQMKLFGLLDLRIRELAVTSVDGNMLAVGDPEAVRGAIDSARTKTYANPELVSLAGQDPGAIMGFGGNLSEGLMESLRVSNPGVARELTAVRKFYGSLGMTNADLELMVAARTVDSYSAKNLGDSVEGLKALAGFFIGRLTPAKESLARAALNNLKVTTQGNELQIRTAVAQSQVAPLMRGN
jgi:hypothetical protein